MVRAIWLMVAAFWLAGGALAQQITLWHQEQPPGRVARVQQLIDEFNRANPGVTVRQEVQNWGDVYPKTLAAIRAGVQPDILFTIPDFTLVVKETGAVQPVTALARALNSRYRFLNSALEPYSYDNQIWAVPMYGMTQSLWYRKDLLDAAGVKPPTNWDELLAAAKKLTADGRYGIGIPANRNLYTDQVIYNFMIGAGAKELFDARCGVTFNTPATVRALGYYRDLFQYSPPDSTGWAWGEAEAAFASGKVAMILQFTTVQSFDTQAKQPAGNLGVVAIPAPAGAKRGSIYYSNGAMILTNDAAKRTAAERFISFLLEPRNYGRFLTMEPALFLPATESGMSSVDFFRDRTVIKYSRQVQSMLTNSRSGSLFGFTSGRVCKGIGDISAQNLLAQVVQKVIVEKQTPEQAAAWGQEQMARAAR
ncbi:MAG: sugar ABC transporter substrate-binding protein [Meiothermus sp.]|nr:sugar ABC transporter substrate-binding protein [Meiothermus sp.]